MTCRTPLKVSMDAVESSSGLVSDGASAEMEQISSQRVRRSIGEWENGKPNFHTSVTPPPLKKAAKPVALPKSKPVITEGSPSRACKTADRVAEAKAIVVKAKTYLSQSRNLRTDIKTSLTEALDGLYRLVKDTDSKKGSSRSLKERNGDKTIVLSPSCSFQKNDDVKKTEKIEETMARHMELIRENTQSMKILQETLDKRIDEGVPTEVAKEGTERILKEVQELRRTSDETGCKVAALQELIPSYAEVLTKPKNSVTPTKLPKHSIIISSENDQDTSDQVLGKVREVLDAKNSGLQVTRVRKIKNQKVVISCGTKSEITKLTQKLSADKNHLKVEEARNKDPLVIVKNLLSFIKDEEIVSCLASQNINLFSDLTDEDVRAKVRYRRRARNPHENHVVLQVSPNLWQKLTLAKRIHIDLQYVAVQDQSPLVQCTRCLGYGHGRRLCKELVDLCSFCAGPHLRKDCPTYLTGETPTCRNCNLAKCQDTSHTAFDQECPIRKRWDAIARASVAYC